eukprot:TRINITY_DN6763_c1_g1_i1.p1 TRINITY_DN6763_c1_g1~~TRINITY_DN6763_c1_g1_i1.p1  ORF type:complete len:272 (+),score=42.90 TRINITY_DN6763_c1_g1_i1:393-1208(+)
MATIAAALRGNSIVYETKIGASTFRQLIAAGVYLNAMEPGLEYKDVPKLSPLLLLMWAARTAENLPEARVAWSQEQRVAFCFTKMFYLEPNFTWQQYELFHAYWELLMRAVFDGEERTLADHYRVTGASPSLKLNWKPRLVNKLPHHFATAMKSNLVEQADLQAGFYLPAAGNPGFGIITLEGHVALCFECRFSDPSATTKLCEKEIAAKCKLTSEQLSAHTGSHFLVIAAYRASSSVGVMPGCVVLDRSHLDKVYTPSLNSRPQFILGQL